MLKMMKAFQMLMWLARTMLYSKLRVYESLLTVNIFKTKYSAKCLSSHCHNRSVSSDTCCNTFVTSNKIWRLRGTVTSRATIDSRVLILCKWASSLWDVNEAFTVRALSPSNMPTIGRRRAEMTGALLSREDRHSCMKIAITEQSNFSVMPCYLHKSRLW